MKINEISIGKPPIERVTWDEIESLGGIEAWHLEEIRRLYNETPHLFEANSEYLDFKEFASTVGNQPLEGVVYYLISVDTIPQAKLLTVTITGPGKLTAISMPNLFFDFGSGPKPFPYNKEGVDLLQHTILCDSPQEQQHYLTLMDLKFAEWRITKRAL